MTSYKNLLLPFLLFPLLADCTSKADEQANATSLVGIVEIDNQKEALFSVKLMG